MNERSWQTMWEVFHRALEAPAGERAGLVRDACGTDAALHARVLELLDSHDAGGFLDMPLSLGGIDTRDGDDFSGRTVDRYEIQGVVGEGGMGVVYAAQQREPVERRVALKVVKLGMDTREVLARFESERQALALMSHPGIASVLDCGSTSEGRPYFVMELVDGAPITEYCNARGLDVTERAELLARVCDAVQHAHRKGIVHRDLKPSNVLVVEAEGGAIPKVIDFGVAKATAPGPAERTLQTQAGRLIGTPEYMSPEQADMSPDIDTQTDVYALGVLAYELLTGVLPFDFAGKSSAEIQSLVRGQEPPAPSRRVSTLGGTVTAGAGPFEDAGALQRSLRGELDWIVMKALEKDRARRYGSVAELAADLRRYLRDEPVSAGPPGARYRLGKLVKRHRTAAIGALAVLVTLVAGIIATSWFAVVAAEQRAAAETARLEAEAARDVARAEADRARAINDVLFDMLEAPDPTRPPMTAGEARDIKVVDVLARAAASADETAADNPRIAANVHEVVGRMYLRLGLYPEAEGELRAAYESRRGLLGEDHPDTLAAGNNLATAIESGGRRAEAIEIYRPVLETRRRVLGADHEDTIVTIINLANALVANDQLDDAEPLFREALERGERVLGDSDDHTLSAVTGLAFILNRRGDAEAAEPLYRRVYEQRLDTLGPDHPGTLSAMNNLAAALQSLSRLEEAEAIYADLVDGFRRVLGPEHVDTLNASSNYGVLLFRQGKPAEAEEVFRQVVEVNTRTLGAEHPQTLISTNNLARMIIEQGRFDDAAAIYRDLLPRARQTYPPGHVNLALFRGGYGFLLTLLERHAEAERELLAAHQGMLAAAGAEHPQTLSQVRRLVDLYEAWGKPEQAAEFRALLPDGRS